MAKRKIINIDESKCNGCGLCIPNCREGALRIVDGKARLVNDVLCDGLGACLGHCPQGAITIEERDARPFDEKKVEEHISAIHKPSGCPGSRIIDRRDGSAKRDPVKHAGEVSELRQWPIQIMLVPEKAPYLNGVDLLIAADCVPFAYGAFHDDILKGKTLLVGCPKLDDMDLYSEKIGRIIKDNDIISITYAHMEVPCCSGLIGVIQDAIAESGKDITFKDITITVSGERRP